VSFLRNVKADLVDKRLWPVAVALLVALVAVPLALGRGGGSDKPDATAPPAPAGKAPTAQVTLDTSVPTKEIDRKGRVRDPFKGNPRKAAASTSTKTAPSSGGGSPAPSGASSSHASPPAPRVPASSGRSSTSVTVAPARPVATKQQIAKAVDRALKANDGVTVRFSSSDEIGHAKHIGPMTALPSSSYPFVVFGGLSDAKTAVFIVSANVRATGDGKCSPSPRACQLVALRAGDGEQLDYLNGDGKVNHYALRVLRVHGGSSSAGASTARASRRGSPWALATARHAALVAARAAGR
jgi:hypothetical protein